MPDLEIHLAQVARNEAAAGHLASIGEYAWAVTCLFYAALHLVEAHLRRIGRTSQSHLSREAQMRELAELNVLRILYKDLQRLSEDGRYGCRTFSRAEFNRVRTRQYVPLSARLRALSGVS